MNQLTLILIVSFTLACCPLKSNAENVSITQSSSSDPSNCYLGISGGYGEVTNSLSIVNAPKNTTLGALINIILLNKLSDLVPRQFNVASTASTVGGLSGRVYGGYYFDFAKNFTVGPDIGLSFYPKAIRTQTGTITTPTSKQSFTSQITSHADGLDVLVNISYAATPRILLNLKPGAQFSREQSRVFLSNYSTQANYSATFMLLPEIMLGANLQLTPSYPVFVNVFFQQVFGAQNAAYFEQVSNRRLVNIGLEYHY